MTLQTIAWKYIVLLVLPFKIFQNSCNSSDIRTSRTVGIFDRIGAPGCLNRKAIRVSIKGFIVLWKRQLKPESKPEFFPEAPNSPCQAGKDAMMVCDLDSLIFDSHLAFLRIFLHIPVSFHNYMFVIYIFCSQASQIRAMQHRVKSTGIIA